MNLLPTSVFTANRDGNYNVNVAVSEAQKTGLNLYLYTKDPKYPRLSGQSIPDTTLLTFTQYLEDKRNFDVQLPNLKNGVTYWVRIGEAIEYRDNDASFLPIKYKARIQ